ncbi:unnamed protein product, partial [Didymodactylos carnosus]
DNKYIWITSQKEISKDLWCPGECNVKGRPMVMLKTFCQIPSSKPHICLGTRLKATEQAPFICVYNRREQAHSISIATDWKKRENFPVIIYDKDKCIVVQSSNNLYYFCFRRQNCTGTNAYCLKWIQAKNVCQYKGGDLLTIETENERQFVSSIVIKYLNESLLTHNGSTYKNYQLAQYLWIDGVRTS